MKRLSLIAWIMIALSSVVAAGEDDDKEKEYFWDDATFTVIEENDLFVDTDRHYSQGLKLAFMMSELHMPKWLSSSFGAIRTMKEPRNHRWGFVIGQSIYTPGDITVATLLPNDRPYAGWLYTGMVLQRRSGKLDDRLETLESFEVNLGIIGPESLADKAQTWVHEVRGFTTPKGWDNQLQSEPGLAMKYVRAWRYRFPANDGGFAFDLIPHAGGSLGNVSTAVHVGGTFRVGYNLPDDYGPQTIDSLLTPDPGEPKNENLLGLGLYGFAGVDGRAIAYSAFLDGNLFRSGHEVPREPFVADLKVGAGMSSGCLDFVFSLVFRTREFKGQNEQNAFGSVMVTCKF